MEQQPLTIRVAQTLGLTTTLFAAGSNFALSYYLIPRLLDSPTPTMLTQWQDTFISGRATIPPAAVLSSLIYSYLAYHAKTTALPSQPLSKVYAYSIAAVCGVAMIPYTFIFMRKTNSKLIERAKQVRGLKVKSEEYIEAKGEVSSHTLVDWWAVLNLARSVMLTTSGVLGVWTALN